MRARGSGAKEQPQLITAVPVRHASAHKTHISLKNVGLTFKAPKGPQLVALDNINLEITPGEFLCIVGPSGCGKTSLLHQIAGLSFPTSGEVQLNQRRVQGPGTDRILMFQEHGLFPWLTVGQNVEFGLRMAGIPRDQRRETVDRYLKMVQLSGFKESYIHQLSGGMRQRVALARALATEPDILLMDEPFAALDAQTRDMLHDELEGLWERTGRTIVFVTHNVREAVRLGDRVVLMTFRPGTIKNEYVVNMPRPRHIEEGAVAALAGNILSELRCEIDRSRDAEFHL
ncbi:MAG TPA: ABC transporter ATP-binding protein [Acidisarcina sp.]